MQHSSTFQASTEYCSKQQKASSDSPGAGDKELHGNIAVVALICLVAYISSYRNCSASNSKASESVTFTKNVIGKHRSLVDCLSQ